MSLEQERMTKLVVTRKAELEAEVTNTQAEQLQLDRATEDVKKLHQERQGLPVCLPAYLPACLPISVLSCMLILAFFPRLCLSVCRCVCLRLFGAHTEALKQWDDAKVAIMKREDAIREIGEKVLDLKVGNSHLTVSMSISI